MAALGVFEYRELWQITRLFGVSKTKFSCMTESGNIETGQVVASSEGFGDVRTVYLDTVVRVSRTRYVSELLR